jgi:hypothetical protein
MFSLTHQREGDQQKPSQKTCQIKQHLILLSGEKRKCKRRVAFIFIFIFPKAVTKNF